MSLCILQSGLLDTIQDQGRFGYGHLGINPSGAMDPLALAVANLLVGNPYSEPALEMHFPAPALRFETDALIALAGADFSPTIDGRPVPVHAPVLAGGGSVLRFGRPVSGARAYLAVQGGFELTPWLGSCSTHLTAQAGGWEGRALRSGDVLPFRQEQPMAFSRSGGGYRVLPWKAGTSLFYSEKPVIRFVPGAEYAELEPAAAARLETARWTITAQADRMGYRLRGPDLTLQHPLELVSSAVVRGTIQLLPDGGLIVLMADSQTTGGYPRIGHAISADASILAQLLPGQAFQFQLVQHRQAFEVLRRQQTALRQLRWGCIFRLRETGLLR